MTALTAYLTTATASISTDCKIVTSTGGGTTNKNTTIGKNTGYGLLASQGTTFYAADTSLPDPNDKSWLWDDTTLADNNASFSPGTWTATMTLELNASSITADLYCRVYRRAANGTFYLIVQMHSSGHTINTTETNFTLSATTTSASDPFQTGDRLYIDQVINCTVNTTGSNTTVVKTYLSNSSTLGHTNGQVVTPGYIPIVSVQDDAAMRFRMRSAAQLRDAAMRFRLISLSNSILKNAAMRFRLANLLNKDASMRFRLLAATLSQNDAAMRFKTKQTTSQDAAMRFRLSPYAHLALLPTPQRRTGVFPSATRRQTI